jgi:hypothetical protein
MTPIEVIGESGYKEFFKEVTIESIATYLRKHQKVIESWVEFSDDIRHSPAWGFGRDKNGSWQVVYADHGNPIESFTFDNEVDACARMIKETIESIRHHES